MTARVLLVMMALMSASAARAETLEVIDLLHLDAPTLAASLSGREAPAAHLLDEEAAHFAVAAMRHADERTQARAGRPEPIPVSRSRAMPAAAQDLSSLLPEGLAAPPVAAPNRNALLVRGDPRAVDELREVIALLDVPTPMVNVELQVDELSTEAGAELSAALRGWHQAGEMSAGDVREPLLGFAVGGLRGVLDVSARDHRRHAVTATNVTGMSGTPLIISSGEVRPWIDADVWYDPWGRRQVRQFTRAVFVGVTLRVKPTVNADDTVTMVLRPVVSEVVGPAARVGAGDVVRRRLVETTVRVADGQPLVIGGLDRRIDEMTRSLPPSLGWMRGTRSSAMTVTPTIIRPTR